MTKSNGDYTENLAHVRELLARLDERGANMAGDLAEIKGHVRELNGTLDAHGKSIAVLATRQKIIAGSLALVGTGVATFVLNAVLR